MQQRERERDLERHLKEWERERQEMDQRRPDGCAGGG